MLQIPHQMFRKKMVVSDIKPKTTGNIELTDSISSTAFF